MRLDEIKQLTEAKNNYFASEDTTQDVVNSISKEMDRIVEKYKHKEASSDSIPSAPNSAMFRAVRSGMISHEKNVHVHGGQYGVSKTYSEFIKVGGNVDLETKKAIIEEISEVIQDFVVDLEAPAFQIPGKLNCANGVVYVSEVHGTNWGGVGIYVDKYHDYDAGEYKKYMSEL